MTIKSLVVSREARCAGPRTAAAAASAAWRSWPSACWTSCPGSGLSALSESPKQQFIVCYIFSSFNILSSKMLKRENVVQIQSDFNIFNIFLEF